MTSKKKCELHLIPIVLQDVTVSSDLYHVLKLEVWTLMGAPSTLPVTTHMVMCYLCHVFLWKKIVKIVVQVSECIEKVNGKINL